MNIFKICLSIEHQVVEYRILGSNDVPLKKKKLLCDCLIAFSVAKEKTHANATN